jgi:hypothetical protein
MQSEWIPLADAAAALKITWSQAYAKALSGELAAKKVGARWLVTRRSVEALLRSSRTEADGNQ